MDELQVVIRPEQHPDISFVRNVHCAAFPTAAEADLVDALRANGNLLVSLVALDEADLVGHIAFSPVSIDGVSLVGAGLAPVAMRPSHQGRGFGGRLIREGLAACRTAGVDYVVVLGEPGYYQRFGFTPASKFGLDNEYAAGNAFMAVELTPNCLSDIRGLVRYGDEFRVFS